MNKTSIIFTLFIFGAFIHSVPAEGRTKPAPSRSAEGKSLCANPHWANPNCGSGERGGLLWVPPGKTCESAGGKAVFSPLASQVFLKSECEYGK
jgi:hypothetical protein